MPSNVVKCNHISISFSSIHCMKCRVLQARIIFLFSIYFNERWPTVQIQNFDLVEENYYFSLVEIEKTSGSLSLYARTIL